MSQAPGSAGRALRRTVKKVDYAKEQEFSDEDIFEDSADEEPQPKRKGRPRKSSMMRDESDEEMVENRRPVYTEKGYDPMLLPIRDRFPFLPEYEEDGSPKIDLIVGRRPVDEKEDAPEEVEIESEDEGRRTRKRNNNKSKKSASSPAKNETSGGPVEYEYLVKYKGRSYLHLEWKSGADLESMNKSAKGIYRRYLKKLAAGTEEDLENPDFDPSFAIPERIIDEADQEITIELTDKELLRWEKQREKELEEDDDEEEDDETGKEDATDKDAQAELNGEIEKKEVVQAEEEKKDMPTSHVDDWGDEELDYSLLSLDKLREIINRDGTYYPKIEGSDNAYRDGYVTEPPKKPRASYLFFQCTMRSYVHKRNPDVPQSELMTILGDTWRAMSEEERAPFLQLANEEAKQYEKERALMEKAQKPNEVWQPLRRCRLVLDRLVQDSFANIFLEPVDTEEFPDYDEFIDLPMDLGTVRKKLDNRKYQAPEQFARDMRRVWNNCKIYNQHGSAIWHVADYMSKQFERLHHAWVLEFRERYLRWADPRARPWEHSCRMHDGKCETPDHEMVLCDHCDAMYGYKCLKNPLKKIPTKAWHCPDCKPKLKSVKGTRMLSAVAENAARKRAELGDLPKKVVKQTMYLVKWKGLGYEYCTWETREDINDDVLIAQYHRLNNTFPDEPDMPEEVVDKFLEGAKHVNVENAGGISCIPILRSQLYAQTRSFQFAKCGLDIPEKVVSEIGPKAKAALFCNPASPAFDNVDDEEEFISHPREVIECVTNMVFKVARKESSNPIRSCTSLPPPMHGEYDAIVPITSKGLMMNVGEIHGSVAFLGYRSFPDGKKGPAERANLIRNVGDKIIAVDGVSTVAKSFKDVILMLRESGKNKFAYMRFLENRYAVCENDLASVGAKGRYALEELQTKFTTDRQRLVVQRKHQLLEEEQEPAEEGTKGEDGDEEDGSDAESDEGSEGEFQPESDDEELVVTGKAKEVTLPAEEALQMAESAAAPDPEKTAEETTKVEPAEEKKETEEPVLSAEATAKPEATGESDARPSEPGILHRQETTRSLAYRLLDIDLGYSSDEGGDDDCAYFLDAVDDTFTRKDELAALSAPKSKKKKEEESATIPVRQNEFSTRGDRAKLASAVALTSHAPSLDDFDNFPYPSQKEIEAAEKKAEEAQQGSAMPSPNKTSKRSTVKVEQLSVATGEIIHIWANVESAAATLQLPLNELRQVLRGEYDEVLGDEIGGYKWRYALAGAKVTAGTGSSSRGGKKAKEAWLEFRDKLYDPNEPHIYKNGNRLRDYQVDGVNWLASTWYKKQGCVLADEMGLGKTVQIVCYIEHLFRVEKIRRPFLIVVPLSTIEHWRREFEGWTDIVISIYHDRQRVWRDVLREYEWYYEDRPHTPDFLKFDVLVTTYDTLIGDFDVISQIPFRVAVVDEAHRLRNQKGKLLECMREISAQGTMHYGFQSRILMSGTPLQNDLTELWTLLNFIEPFKFPDLDDFQVNFGNMNNQQQVENLQRMISPFMLRRVKEDVAKDIPAKEETVIDVELTSIQKQYYRAIFEHNHAFLNLGATRQSAPKLMNIQMELRKVCNHPFLLEGVEHRETERQFKEFQEKGVFDGKTPEERHHMLNEHGYIMTSGKMVLLDKLLPKLRQEGHKILIFSQMVRMLDLISEYCEFRDFKYERLDGRVRGTERQKSIDRFESEPDSFIFLLSTRAGGVGINLTAADICIIFDSDWNPQNDIQAQARCHRIGQTKDVRIYRLVTSRSFEQEMFDRASRKLGLEQAVLGTFEKDKEDDKPSQKEMEQLLKKGAYALLEDANDEITNQFCADDIDAILAQRTRTRVVEGAKTASWLNKQGMMVTKSKFSAEAGGTELDMDDPLFWQKVMPDFVTPSIMLQKLNDLTDDIEGTGGKGRGRGRGRGRRKKSEEDDREKGGNEEAKSEAETDGDAKSEAETDVGDKGSEKGDDSKDADAEVGIDQKAEEDDEEMGVDELLADETLEEMPEEEEESDKPKVQLSRTNIRKVHKFMSDLKSMMEGIFDEAEDEELSGDEKDTCQKLLLTISVKEKIFNDEQRRLARIFLKRLEGDRRRRCRTSEQTRFIPGHEDEQGNIIPEQLMIVGKKRRKRRKKGEVEDAEPDKKRRRRKSESAGGYLGEDGYLHHSDSEGDWSDVGDNLYKTGTAKDKISSKEARRRRQWAADDDDATAAGRPWPAFPRHLVKKFLSTVLDEVIKYDQEKGGVFSVPVPKEDFPEYYEQIEKPMDYGTMKDKLENGEYRSAQAMQKDFVLILQNCRQFNAPTSDIVKEARRQHLKRPEILKAAATKHNLFMAEDGSVLEIAAEEKGSAKKKKAHKKKKRDAEQEQEDGAEEAPKNTVEDSPIPRKKKGKKKVKIADEALDEEAKEAQDDNDESSEKKKTRIRIKVKDKQEDEAATGKPKKGKKKAVKRKKPAEEDENDAKDADIESTPIPKKKRKKTEEKPTKKKRPKKPQKEETKEVQDEEQASGKQVAEKESNNGEVPDRVDDQPVEASSKFLDPGFWRKGREELDGSFDAARVFLTKEGPWELPDKIPENKFADVARATLAKMDKYDRYSVFAEAVTDEEAPGYSEVVKNPMDFGTMMKKVNSGEYGNGSEAAAAFYEDLLLVFDNCRQYNDDDSEVTEEAGRILGYLPETYASACATVAKRYS